ncbi:MAG: MC/SLC25 family protein [bacterium]
MKHAIQHIYTNEGVKGFQKGFIISLISQTSIRSSFFGM